MPQVENQEFRGCFRARTPQEDRYRSRIRGYRSMRDGEQDSLCEQGCPSSPDLDCDPLPWSRDHDLPSAFLFPCHDLPDLRLSSVDHRRCIGSPDLAPGRHTGSTGTYHPHTSPFRFFSCPSNSRRPSPDTSCHSYVCPRIPCRTPCHSDVDRRRIGLVPVDPNSNLLQGKASGLDGKTRYPRTRRGIVSGQADVSLEISIEPSLNVL